MDKEKRDNLIEMSLDTYRCTTVPVKVTYWPAFTKRVNFFMNIGIEPPADLQKWYNIIVKQFTECGKKYGFTENAEWTDVIRHFDPKWILGTMLKYIGRFVAYKRERDLIKIATYAYILWLQDGWYGDPITNESNGPPFSGVRWDAIKDATSSDPGIHRMMEAIYMYDYDMHEQELAIIFYESFALWKREGFHDRKEHDEDVEQHKKDVEES